MASRRSTALLLALLAAAGLAARDEPGTRAALVVEVVDAESGTPLPARVVVRGPDGQPLKGEYELLPGGFTGEDGRLELPVSPGSYSVDVHRGIDYVSQEQRLTARSGETARARVALQPWLRLRERGWANGDAHAHLYTDAPRDEAMTRTVRRIARAQGVDFLCATQTWAGYRDEDWRSGFAKVSDSRFALFYGAEMPKYRTGHTFWYGLQSTRGLFDGAMDESFEKLYHETEGPPPRWSFDAVPFPYVPDVEVVARLAEAEDAFAVVPHPTSWWWQPRGAVRKYVTNVASSLPAGLLGGSPWRGLVVAGYDHDHYFYQDLWFRVLDAGYRMTPFGELDGGYPPSGRFWYGSVRTYLKVGAATTREAIVRAARAGHTFVTSGPTVFGRVEGGFEPGDVVPADGRERALDVEAYASGEREDRLSYVVLFRNSRLHRVWDLRGQERRRFEATLRLRESEPAWYALKAYGRTRRTPEQLDVRGVVDGIVAGTPAAAWTGDSDVALTSPFYFRPPGAPVEPAPLVSRVRLRLVDEAGRPVHDARVRVRLRGRELESQPAPGGEVQLRVPVHAVLVLEAPGRPTLRRTLYLDHEAPRARLERLASGTWLDAYAGRLQPGQVPWTAFDLDGTRRDLAELDWTVAWRPNERDPAWERFEAALR